MSDSLENPIKKEPLKSPLERRVDFLEAQVSDLISRVRVLNSYIDDLEKELKNSVSDLEYACTEAAERAAEAYNTAESASNDVFEMNSKLDKIADDVSDIIILK